MNWNEDKDANEPKELCDAFCIDPDLQELLGIPGFEKLIREIEHPAGWMDEVDADAPSDEIFHLPIRINLQILLDDLDRILRIFDKPEICASDWEGISQGFFEQLLVKYKLYYVQMLRLGKKQEAQYTKEQMIGALRRKLAERTARRIS